MSKNEASSTQQSVDYVYIRTAATLEPLVQRLSAATQVALDSEADSLHNYFEKVCLIQLSVGGEHYIVDPLAGLDLSGLLETLTTKRLILHGGDYDLRMMRTCVGFRPRGEVFDTMIAAQLLGIEQIGLAALVERCFGMTIGKTGQKSDWSRRPLTEQQLCYAANDTRYLEALAERLTGELSERGRIGWHKESCRAMVESADRDRPRDRENAWRIKGAGRLARRQLAYLRELWRWRDGHARRADLPAFKVLGNDQMFELLYWAEVRPNESLRQGPKLARNIRGERLQTLEAALARAAAMEPADWPERRIHDRPEIAAAPCRKQIDALREQCAGIAAELGIAAATLAPRAALESIVGKGSRSTDEIMENGLLSWQAELVKGAVEKCLNSDR